MCDEVTKNAIDFAILKKFRQQINKSDEIISKAYGVIKEEEEEEIRKKRDIISRFNKWKSIGLQTLTGHLAKFENDLTYILFSIEFTIRNISTYLRNSANNKLKFLGRDVNHFKNLVKKNMPFTRMFIKELIKLKCIGMIICRRTKNSIIKLVGREKAPFIIVLNTPPLPNFQQVYGCSWTVYIQEFGNESPFMEGCEAEAAGYAVLSTTTVMVMAFKKSEEVMEFVMDSRSGNFIQLGRLWIPEYSPQYIVDESKLKDYCPKVQSFLSEKKNTKTYENCYTGQFIIDINRIIHYGGLYLAPPEASQERGKLRLIFDCIPLAYILDKMGGKTTHNLGESFLKEKPMGARAHSAFYGGSPKNLDEMLQFMSLS